MKDIKIVFTSKEKDILRKISAGAATSGLEAYVVGGYVRDKILGRDNKDIDVVCVGDAMLLAHAVAKQFKIRPQVHYFKNFGTAQIKLGAIEIEFVMARKESYSRDSRKPAVEPGTLQDDQLRRDFTINAMAFNLKDIDNPQVVDPFNGLADLEKGIIRTPQDPMTTFDDDPLRMMRAIRFATQLQFKIDNSCIEAIKVLSDRIHIVSKERISDELHKIIKAPIPSIGLKLLDKCALLEKLLPQLCALKGSQTIDNIGHKDNFLHSLQVLDNIAPHTDNLWLRYAALLHDIGKAKVKRFDPEHGWTFHGHEIVSSKMMPKIFEHLKWPTQEQMPYVRKIVGLHHRPISLSKENITDSAIRRLLFDAGEELDDLMTLCEADITSKNEVKRKRYLNNFKLVREKLIEVEEKDKIRNWQPPIPGELIMQVFNIPPSREVGIIKDAIREAILEGEIPNAYDAAYAYMIEKGKSIGLIQVM